ncbi:unnamed protein product, partial [Polarella glacialis]
VCELDFEGNEDGSLVERLAALLLRSAETFNGGDSCSGAMQPQQTFAVRLAHKLHECIVESKLVVYPFHLLIFLQTQCAGKFFASAAPVSLSPSSPACSALAVDQLLTVEQFYKLVRGGIGAKHQPLLSEDFLVERCTAMRSQFAEGGRFAEQLNRALREDILASADTRDPLREQQPVERAANDALAAVFFRLHGLPGSWASLRLEEITSGTGSVLARLPRLRRALPEASVQGLRRLLAALQIDGNDPKGVSSVAS